MGELNRLDPSYAVPAVLTGDFNARSNENRPVYREHLTRLRADGWRNSESLARHDTTQVPGASTLNGFGAKIDGRWYYRQISRTGTDYDYVWVRKGAAVATWQTVLGPAVRRLRVNGRSYPFLPTGRCPPITARCWRTSRCEPKASSVERAETPHRTRSRQARPAKSGGSTSGTERDDARAEARAS